MNFINIINKPAVIKTVVLIFIMVLAYLCSAFVFPKELAKKADNTEEQNPEKKLHCLSSTIVNLFGTSNKRFLKIELALEYIGMPTLEETKKLIEQKQVFLTDELIMILSSKTVEALDGHEKKELLKEEIRKKFNNVLFGDKKEGIVGIYYQSFLIQ